MEFRDLRADEIECRIGTITVKEKTSGLSLLLYKNARCDMNILDETVGALNWQRRHYEHKGNIYCGIAIWDSEKKQWIEKEDCGAESRTEKEKGEASDSFKRAGTNWGIGRELYTAPFIWIDGTQTTIKPSGNSYRCYDTFFVKSIEIENKKIISLEIHRKGTEYRGEETVYSWKAPINIGDTKKQALIMRLEKLQNKSEWYDWINRTYGSIDSLTVEQFISINKELDKRGIV